VLVGSALALFLVLIAAFATSTTLYLRAERERIKAERHSRRSLAAIGLVREVVESTKPAFLEQDVNVAKLLERFSDRLEEAFPEDPDIEAAVRTSIALLYRDLDRTLPKSNTEGYLTAAQEHLERAYRLRTEVLGERHEETVEAARLLSDLLVARGEYEEAERLARLVRREGRPEESEQLCRQLLLARDPSERERPSRDPTIRDLASALLAQGKVDEARTLYGDWRVPLALEVTEWYQGRLDLSGKNPILVLYFHEGCPFSHRFVPGVASLYRRYRDEGLRMVGVRNPEWFDSTEEEARAFIDEKGLTFPVANAAPGFGATYDFRGVPQLAMVVSGAVVWRGHPNELGSEVIEGALAAVKNGELDEGEGHV
jgi:hypothetical protein